MNTDEARAEIAAGILGYCPTCYQQGVLTVMQPAGKRSFICPRQGTEARVISEERRASVRETAAERDEKVGF